MKVIIYLILTLIVDSWAANLCPAKETIAPCICFEHTTFFRIICSGRSINEEVLTNIFGNKVISHSTKGGINLNSTSIIKLNKSQFGSNVFGFIMISFNSNLTYIESDAFQASGSKANTILISKNPKLSFSNILDVIHNFSNLTLLHLYRSINGEIPARAFQPRSGSSFGKNLEIIGLTFNNITSIGSHAFYNLPKLTSLHLNYNEISKIDSNGLTFNLNQTSINEKLHVILNSNNLTENSFSNNAIQNKNGTRVLLYLGNNQINYLPEQAFKPYVHNNAVEIVADRLNLICDCRMNWLLNLPTNCKEAYHNVKCKNYNNKNIFSLNSNDLKCN